MYLFSDKNILSYVYVFYIIFTQVNVTLISVISYSLYPELLITDLSRYTCVLVHKYLDKSATSNSGQREYFNSSMLIQQGKKVTP
jgi:hypothetical protein